MLVCAGAVAWALGVEDEACHFFLGLLSCPLADTDDLLPPNLSVPGHLLRMYCSDVGLLLLLGLSLPG